MELRDNRGTISIAVRAMYLRAESDTANSVIRRFLLGERGEAVLVRGASCG